MARRSRPTLADVAARAGVGIATVDRVLNERGNVKPEIARRVIAAARYLGLRRLLPGDIPGLRIEALIPRPDIPLTARLIELFRAQSRSFGPSVTVETQVLADEEGPTHAKALSETTADAVIVYAPSFPEVNEAVASLAARGVPVVTIVSDLPDSPRLAYAGTDHLRAGRTAAYFMSRMARPGPVVLLCNHVNFAAHMARMQGFRDYIAETGAGFPVVEVVEGGDDRALSAMGLRVAFRRRPDATGVYNVGAANLGVAAAIRTGLLDAAPVFIGHELTDNTRRLLGEGLMALAIDQNPELQVRRAVALLQAHFGLEAPEAALRDPVPFTLYGPENA